MSSVDNGLLSRIVSTGGAFLAGIVGTAVFTVVFLWLAQPFQVPIYEVLYLPVGPWTATTTATILSFTLASMLAISAPTLVAIDRRGHRDRLRPLGLGLFGFLGLTALTILLAAFLGVISLLVAVIVVSLFIVTVPFSLRYLDLWPDGAIVFTGGVPVLIFSLLLLGVGLGWGGGYDLVATEVSAERVDAATAVSLAEVPTIRDDLLNPDDDTVLSYCELEDGQRTCRLSLRGYEHEARVAGFLNRHGVRCQFRNARPATQPAGQQSFIAEANGTYYRISCLTYGD